MTPIVLLLFVPPAILLALVPYTWRHRAMSGARSFLMLVLAIAVWGICYALQIATVADLSVKAFWSAAKYVGIAVTPVVWFAFALEYTGRGEWLTRRRFAALFIMPSITVIMAFVNPLNFMWSPPQLVTTGQFVTTDSSFGLWFWVHAAYSYIFILLGIALLARSLLRFPQVYRQQAGALVLAAALPLLANAIFIFGLSPNPYLDLTPVAFASSALLFAWALFRYQLLDVVPVARDAVVASMSDVVVVIDLQNRIVDINPAGQRAIGSTAKDIIGQPVGRVFSNWSHLVERYQDMPEVHEEIALPAAGEGQSYFDLRVTPIPDRHGRITGRLVVLRDITQGRLAESLSDSERRMRHRVTQLQTVAEVARAITSIRKLAELLPTVTRVIGERFDLYHVAIFLLDEAREYAILQAANSEGGQQMLAQGYQLKVGEASIVGHVAGTGEARIASDVGHDAMFLNNPILPLTRSEIALPLKVQGRVIGVLDAQSAVESAFADEDVLVLTILADQVVAAIENARSFDQLTALAEENRVLLERSEKSVEELNALTRRLTTESWEKYLLEEGGELVVENINPDLSTAKRELPELDQAVERRDLIVSTDSHHTAVAVPIFLRGELLGTLGLEDLESDRVWNEDDLAIVKGVTERIALALDNARLFQETQTALSETEQLYDISVQIGTATTLEDLLQAAVAPSIATEASSAGIWLFELDEAGQPAQMELAASWTRAGTPPLPLRTRFRVADYPSSKLWLHETGRPSFIGDTAHEERLDVSMHALFQQANIGATAFMPLTLGGRWVGIITVTWREPHDFTASEQRMYQSIASQVAVAIENRRLFEQTQRDAERERTINVITSKLRSAMSVDQVLKIAAQELRAATQASLSVIEITPGSDEPSGNGHSADAAQQL